MEGTHPARRIGKTMLNRSKRLRSPCLPVSRGSIRCWRAINISQIDFLVPSRSLHGASLLCTANGEIQVTCFVVNGSDFLRLQSPLLGSSEGFSNFFYAFPQFF